MGSIEAQYETIVDNISKADWEHYGSEFADYSIYQTWAYQENRAEMDNQEISRVVVKDENGNVVTMCQVRIKYIKPLRLKIGYVQWGPLVRGLDGCFRCTGEALNILQRTYVGTRVNVLRIVPNVCDNERGDEFAKLLEASGFYRVPSAKPYHTMLLSLNSSGGLLRKSLHQSWRRKLKKSEAVGIETKARTDDESLTILARLYLDLVRRKGFKGLDPQQFIRTQRDLPMEEKMTVILAYYNNEPVSAHLTSYQGDTAIMLLAASTERGLACEASYLTWWKSIVASNRRGKQKYDVGGIDFEKNPTVSRFKTGVGGEEVSYIGAFDACSSMRARVIWQASEKIYNLVKR